MGDEVYHYGEGPAGTTQHKGTREDCPGPDCGLADDPWMDPEWESNPWLWLDPQRPSVTPPTG